MNLLSQLNAAAGREQTQVAKPDTSLYGQLKAASTSRTLGIQGERRGGNNTRKSADAAWKKAFNGEEMTPPELARRRRLQVEGVFTILLRLERRGMVERCGDRASTGTRRITLWRWIGETEE